MRISLSRLTPGQSRFTIAQNLTCPFDRHTLGFWYLDIHCAPFYLSLSGRCRRDR
jgi:hypothetical protein